MSLAANVSLIVATLDLKLVQLIRGAMRAADEAAGSAERHGCDVLGPAATFERRRVIHPEVRYEARRVIHPEPRYLPRPVVCATPVNADCCPPTACCAPECCASHITPSPIQPPWAVLPWQNPPPPAKVVKVVQRQPDNVRKGAILDCFL